MKRPIEADYTSHVAYTRALEEYCDWLVKSEQEPVAWMCSAFDGKACEQSNHDECENPIPLYTTPPRREWVGLTDAEAQLIYDMGRTPSGMMEMVESKLKEKNTWPTK